MIYIASVYYALIILLPTCTRRAAWRRRSAAKKKKKDKQKEKKVAAGGKSFRKSHGLHLSWYLLSIIYMIMGRKLQQWRAYGHLVFSCLLLLFDGLTMTCLVVASVTLLYSYLRVKKKRQVKIIITIIIIIVQRGKIPTGVCMYTCAV